LYRERVALVGDRYEAREGVAGADAGSAAGRVFLRFAGESMVCSEDVLVFGFVV
jgi:hypothetical protein